MLNDKIKCDCADFYKLSNLKKDIDLDEASQVSVCIKMTKKDKNTWIFLRIKVTE